MPDDVPGLVAAVEALPSVDRAEDLTRLQELVDRYFALPNAANDFPVRAASTKLRMISPVITTA